MSATGDEVVTLSQLKEWSNSGGGGSVADLIYPVGAIYLSTSSTNPQTLFGGTWQRIQDRFLLCAGSSYKAGATGGEAKHKLTVEEMPSHTHQARMSTVKVDFQYVGDSAYIPGTRYSVNMTEAGGDQPHNNMPPYLAVYAWKRTA